MRLAHLWLLGIFLSTSLLAAAAADEHAGVDTSDWRCKFCEFEEGLSGHVEIGAGYLSSDAFKFGEYTGLVDEGGFAIADAGARYRDEDADYFDLQAYDLGLDSRSLTATGGRQGTYSLHLHYDELPHNVSDSGRTPFAGTGGNDLTLPAGWVDAGTTAGMTELTASLRNVELATEREQLEVGAAFIPARHWEVGVNFKRDTKEGTQRTAGAFFFNSSQLVAPVDYVTDQVEAFIAYAKTDWQVKLAYYGSAFDNENTALRWDNPFSPLAAGADRGELALPPDNEFHQVTVAAGYKISDATRTSAQLSVGRMEQNQDFLSATTNPNLAVSALPRSSLDGRVDTLNAALKLTSRLSDAWGFNAAYRHDDRDNKTPTASYDWVSTDTFPASPRENQPYSFTKRAVDLSTDYRASPTAKMVFGFEHENTERDLQEVAESRENTLRIKVIARPSNDVNVDAQLTRAWRDVSTYEVVAGTQPPQNPLLRKYNMADRARTSADFRVSVSPSQTWQYGFGVGVANDDYTGSEIGLTESRSGNVNANVSVLITPVSSLHMFLDHQVMDSRQAGSNAFSVADWFARTRDTIDTAGVGVTHRLQDSAFEVGADYTVSESQSDISVNVGAFPTLKANLHSLQLHTTYFLEAGGNIRAGYRYETFRADDWMLDSVAPDTVSNVVLLGEQAPSYEVHVLTLSTRWEFD